MKTKRESAPYSKELRSIWEEAEGKPELVTDQQRQRRKALAQANEELLARLRARFQAETAD